MLIRKAMVMSCGLYGLYNRERSTRMKCLWKKMKEVLASKRRGLARAYTVRERTRW